MARLGRAQPFKPRLPRIIIAESGTAVLSGISMIISLGVLSPSISYGLTKNSITSILGNLAPSVGVALVQSSMTIVPGVVSYAEMFAGSGGLRTRVIGSAVIRRIT